ncbi:hypothetical protein LJC19_04390 [Oxalobacter sp. OttesenSCG-928-P03]|nr:hypothetical protein [Oxalobacter sp. OttesenSCG-928-P03]
MLKRCYGILLPFLLLGVVSCTTVNEPALSGDADFKNRAVLHAWKLRRGKLLRLAGKRDQYRALQLEELPSDFSETTPESRAKLADRARQLNAVMDDLLAGGDGTTGKNPWQKHTPETLAGLYAKTLGFCEELGCPDERLYAIQLHKLDLQVMAGQLSVADLIDRAYDIFEAHLKKSGGSILLRDAE